MFDYCYLCISFSFEEKMFLYHQVLQNHQVHLIYYSNLYYHLYLNCYNVNLLNLLGHLIYIKLN